MSKPKISIAMATYNGALYIREQLESFLGQTRQPDELVVTDDGSSDGTLGILRDFQSTAPFEVKICRNRNRLGFTRNFEKALSFCSGDVIFISDQDDVWFPGKIERVIPCFDNNPQVMVVINDKIVTDEKLSDQGISALQKLKSVGKDGSAFFPGCCTALRREWRDLSLPIPVDDFTYDCWISLLADALGVRLVLPEPLQFYRRHASNASTWFLASARKTSLLDLVRLYGLRDARRGWLREVNMKRLYGQRLGERAELLRSLKLDAARESALDRIAQEICALNRRIGLMGLPRWRRMPAVVKFSMEGGYANFMGWKSALKDVLR